MQEILSNTFPGKTPKHSQSCPIPAKALTFLVNQAEVCIQIQEFQSIEIWVQFFHTCGSQPRFAGNSFSASPVKLCHICERPLASNGLIQVS